MKKYLLSLALLSAICLQADDTHKSFSDRRYHLQPNDELALAYRYSPEYNEELTIQPDGFVTIKLIGDLKLSGLTLDEARAAILAGLKTRLNDPEITVSLTEFEHPAFTVAGQVSKPGKYDIQGRLSAIEAIAIAGGFKDSAKHSQVILFRRVGPDLAQTHILDLKRMMDPAHPHIEESVDIQPGDLLIVPKNRVSKIADYIHWINIGTYIPM